METEGRHERGTDEPATSALEHAILTDDDDPLAAASGTMRGPDDAPAVRAVLDMPGAAEEARADREARALERAGLTPIQGDPGDEQEHVDRQGRATDALHVETVKAVVIRDSEGQIVRAYPENVAVRLADLAPGEYVALEDWPASLAPGDYTPMGGLPEFVGANAGEQRPTVYAAFGLLDDDMLQKLEELGIDVEEVRDPDEPENDVLDARYDDPVTHLAVAEDGVRRELRVLTGGATDLSGLLPRRKCQAWIDLRFQYESEHPHGAPDELEEVRLRRIGALVEQFANLAVENGEAEGMAIVSVVGHVLDKPGDDVPAAS